MDLKVLLRGLLCALVSLCFGEGLGLSAPNYDVFAIRYGTLRQFRVANLVAGAEESRRLDIPMMVWLVRSADRNVLVDAGFYRQKFFENWDVVDFVKPSVAVARLGIPPEEISDVIITHLHWDHADGADLFPNARVWIQKDEYLFYMGEAWQPGKKATGGIDPEDLKALLQINIEGRLRLVEGDAQEILEGITCYTGGKHTYASQYAGVQTAMGTVVLASDNVYLYENLEKSVPIAATLDPESNLRAQARMKAMVSDDKWIIPGHDPEVFNRFPVVMAGVARISASPEPGHGCDR